MSNSSYQKKICPSCGVELQDISSLYENKTKIYRCNNEDCEAESSFFNEDLTHPKCSICGSHLFKIDHLIPDLFFKDDEDFDGWVCRNCSWGMILS